MLHVFKGVGWGFALLLYYIHRIHQNIIKLTISLLFLEKLYFIIIDSINRIF